jgi:LAO/AO transport system kinase
VSPAASPATARRRPTRSLDGAEVGRRLRDGDLTVAPAALNILESRAAGDRERAVALLREVSPQALGHEPRGHIIGVTGPPGGGKSTLLAALVRRLREYGYGPGATGAATDAGAATSPISSQAVIAVDPSSRRSGGALLGDRVRIQLDRPDPGVFIRSSAAGDRHGGLARGTRAAAEALAAAFDVVVVETVGVGQSETEVADVADTVVVVVQPGGGDVLQFLKAGIMEIPDILVVTKADMGSPATRTVRELRAALRVLGAGHDAHEGPARVLAVSSLQPPTGIDELLEALGERWRALTADGAKGLAARRLQTRRAGALTDFTVEHGEGGVRALGGRRAVERILDEQLPGLGVGELVAELESRLAGV